MTDNKDAQEGTPARKWVGAGELERTGYIDPATGGDDRALVERAEYWAKRHEDFFPGSEGEPNKTSAMLRECVVAIERLTCERDGLLSARDDLGASNGRLQADLSRAREALGRYGRHAPECMILVDDHCGCGFTAALKGEA